MHGHSQHWPIKLGRQQLKEGNWITVGRGAFINHVVTSCHILMTKRHQHASTSLWQS